MKIALFSGSFRTDSLNKKFLNVARTLLASTPGRELDVIEIRDLQIPVYDGDIETKGIPAGVKTLGDRLSAAQALVISTPEYNGSIAGPMKNTIDWVSRLRPVPFEKKPIFLMGASPGGLAAVRGLQTTRAPLDNLGAFVFPQLFGLPKAHEAFQPNGALKDLGLEAKLGEALQKFMSFAERLNT